MNTLSTVDPIVTPPPEAPRDARNVRLWWAFGIMLVLLVGATLGAAIIPIDYYALRPGSIRPTTDLIYVDGPEVHRPSGSISFPTVSLHKATLLDVVVGWLDEDTAVYSDDAILGDRDPDENRQFNQVLMDTSKLVATEVALEHLGYDVPITATGMTIVAVQDGFPADGKLQAGETIVAVDGTPIDDPDDLQTLLGKHGPGDAVVLQIEAAGSKTRREVRLELAAAPDDENRGVLGIQIQPRDLHYEFPFDVSIDSGDVGGPSAGLAFTLSLLDVLTPGELTGGETVTATGTIDEAGNVGPIGGVVQKIAAARDAGVDVFLVPADEYAEAAAHAGNIQVFAVATLDDALAALAKVGGNGLALGTPGEAVPS